MTEEGKSQDVEIVPQFNESIGKTVFLTPTQRLSDFSCHRGCMKEQNLEFSFPLTRLASKPWFETKCVVSGESAPEETVIVPVAYPLGKRTLRFLLS